MTKNMSLPDRIIRIGLAVLIAVLYFTNQISGTLAIILVIVAVIFTATSLINFCPLYPLLGLRRWEKKRKDESNSIMR